MSLAKENAAQNKPLSLFIPNPKLRLREQVREVMRFRHYSVRTEEAYWQWIRRFIVWARGTNSTPHSNPLPGRGGEGARAWRHPREMGEAQVHAFLTHLAVKANVAVSTQNQALKLVES